MPRIINSTYSRDLSCVSILFDRVFFEHLVELVLDGLPYFASLLVDPLHGDTIAIDEELPKRNRGKSDAEFVRAQNNSFLGMFQTRLSGHPQR